MVIPVLFISFISFLLLTVPIGIALGLASVLTIYATGVLTLDTFAQTMVAGLNSFPLMAVPLFTFAGDIMGRGGISKRLLKVAGLMFGRFTGGLGMVAIAACLFFAAISGTGSATVAAIGFIMIPSMVHKGYDKVFSSAMIASAGTVGVIIPPSIPMVIYSIAAGVSVSGMFIAGVIPGLLVGMVLMVYTWFYSKRHGYSGDSHRYTFLEGVKIIIEAIPALMVPVIVLGGIYGGVFTPTEAAAIAVVYGILVSIFVYKEVAIKSLPAIAFNSVLICSTVLIIIGTSAGFGRILTIAQVPVKIAEFILGITTNTYLIILMINIMLLIVGTFMETNASIIILVPILLPVVHQIGIHPIQFGVIMVLNLAIGFVTPPLGANLFMAVQVGGIKFDDIAKGIVPWIGVLIIVLALVTLIPALTLWFPQILGVAF
jgi:C4-dicarboxylate transporter, DctM subunit